VILSSRPGLVILVTGSRHLTGGVVAETLDTLVGERVWRDTPTLYHGAAEGADLLAAAWAETQRFKTIAFPADWNSYGNGAGPKRNQEMVNAVAKRVAMGAECLVVAFWDGRTSKCGTFDCMQRINAAGLPMHVQPVAKQQGVNANG
jgi:hypothetical protein